jgi:hypothetical protein
MSFKLILMSVICWGCASISLADDNLFVASEGAFNSSPDLLESDRGLLCYRLTQKECDSSDFQVVDTDESENESYTYEIEYRASGTICHASISKTNYSDLGWVTTKIKFGRGC